MSVATYLIARLREIGIEHIFGVVGDFNFGFLDEAVKNEIKYVGCSNELNAVYAADGYARIKGAGVASIPSDAGELVAINGISSAFESRVPVVLIVGLPSTQSSAGELIPTISSKQSHLSIFQQFTIASTVLSKHLATKEIDRVLSQLLCYSMPVYIGIPEDVINEPCSPPQTVLAAPDTHDADALKHAVIETIDMLENASSPVIILDIEISRYNLAKQTKELIEKSGIPFAVMMLGKCVIDESHPQYIGVYHGEISSETVKNSIEKADFVLELGADISKYNKGTFGVNYVPEKGVQAYNDYVMIRNKSQYHKVPLGKFITSLTSSLVKKWTIKIRSAIDNAEHRPNKLFQAEKGKKATYARFFDRIVKGDTIPENSIIAVDVGISLYHCAQSVFPPSTTLLCQSLSSGSFGFSVGCLLGASLAAPERPQFLLIGDGAFQSSSAELGNIFRYSLKPRVFLFNNDGYSLERAIKNGPYDDIPPWKYIKLLDVFGDYQGEQCSKEDQFENLLNSHKNDRFQFVEVILDPLDLPDILKKERRHIVHKQMK